jgi:hypothetical protein
MSGEKIVYYGVFVTPLLTPMIKIDDQEEDTDFIVTKDDLNVVTRAIAMKLDGLKREEFFINASLLDAVDWMERFTQSKEENLVKFKTLYAAILDDRVRVRCSSVLLTISTKSDDEKFALLEEFKNEDIEILAAMLFSLHSNSPMEMKQTFAKFVTLGVYETVPLKNLEVIFFVNDWLVFGERKDKYGLVAKTITKCIQNFAQYTWGMEKEFKNIRCLYVGHSQKLNDVDLNQWSDSTPQAKDFPSNWIVEGTIAKPPYTCFVLFCPMNVSNQAKSLVSELLKKFMIPDSEPQPSVLDLSGVFNFNVNSIQPNQVQDIKKLILAECNINIWVKESLQRAIKFVEKLMNLEILDLSYNFLSGKRGFEFVENLFKIRKELKIIFKGTKLAKQTYTFSGKIIY